MKDANMNSLYIDAIRNILIAAIDDVDQHLKKSKVFYNQPYHYAITGPDTAVVLFHKLDVVPRSMSRVSQEEIIEACELMGDALHFDVMTNWFTYQIRT